jgi:hypothetical protein
MRYGRWIPLKRSSAFRREVSPSIATSISAMVCPQMRPKLTSLASTFARNSMCLCQNINVQCRHLASFHRSLAIVLALFCVWSSPMLLTPRVCPSPPRSPHSMHCFALPSLTLQLRSPICSAPNAAGNCNSQQNRFLPSHPTTPFSLFNVVYLHSCYAVASYYYKPACNCCVCLATSRMHVCGCMYMFLTAHSHTFAQSFPNHLPKRISTFNKKR